MRGIPFGCVIWFILRLSLVKGAKHSPSFVLSDEHESNQWIKLLGRHPSPDKIVLWTRHEQVTETRDTLQKKYRPIHSVQVGIGNAIGSISVATKLALAQNRTLVVTIFVFIRSCMCACFTI